MMVYQAVAEYWTSAKEPDYDLKVDVVLPGRPRPYSYKFNRENQFTTRTMKVRKYKETNSDSVKSFTFLNSYLFY